MAGSSRKRPLIEAELEKCLYDDDDFWELSSESDVSSDRESIDSHDSNSIIEDNSDESDFDTSDHDFFVGRDKTTKWSRTPPPTSRTLQHNMIMHLAVSRDRAKHMKDAAEIFGLFFDDWVIELLVEKTNIYIENKVLPNVQRSRDAKFVTKNEVTAFIGLLILAGVMRSSHPNFIDLFSEEDIAGDFFHSTMGYQRFLFLLRCIRFDDFRTRKERLGTDKLAPLRELFDDIVLKYAIYFSPSESVTIDEQLVAFRGRCQFRQYIPSKPNRYGIKVFSMSDARNFYTVNMEVYLGTQPEGPYRVSNTSDDIVMRLVHPINRSGRNVTTDNWYTSIPLANRLLSDAKLTLVGSIRKNEREIPYDFLPNKKREVKSTLFGFTKSITLLSYVPKKSKAVLLLSTLHHDTASDNETGQEKKTRILTFYNMSKGGVDTTDKLCSTYNVGRRTRRWPLALFFHLINVSALNAYIIYYHNNTDARIVRRNFLKQLGKELVKPYQLDRLHNPQIPRKIRRLLNERLHIDPQEEDTPTTSSRKRCYICPRSRNRHSKQVCSDCKKNICSEHSRNVCIECLK